ncbi:MAG: hypothetical protein A2885_08695 [Sphingopyxis sp. RIFCSPHIGHO2_01_FULL_65_24]|nr:MAG: hypothetical protein A2885_08695 [Sphingopyxis sp. RIFCSPHIGHO2_01_FULL_65_24]
MFKPFADLAKTFGFNIDEMESVSASKQRFSQKKKVSQPVKVEEHTIKRMDPIAGEVVSIVGVIRDRQTATSKIENIYAKLGQLGHKMFGLPPKTRAVHITVIDNEGEPNESYTCIGDAQLLGKSLTLGVMVWVRLEAKVTPSVSAWVIAEIHAI